MTQAQQFNREATIQYIAASADVAEDAIQALNLPEATLAEFQKRIEEAQATEKTACKLTPVFGLAAIGMGCVAGFQPLAWQVFSSSSYPDWMLIGAGTATFLSALATVVTICGIDANGETRRGLHNNLRRRIAERAQELVIIHGNLPQPKQG